MKSNSYSLYHAIESRGTKLPNAVAAAARQYPRRGKGQERQTFTRSEKKPANAGIRRRS
jgi:hypothetical protein